MDHIAILAKQRKLLDKIISGEKTIESRWYKFKKTPYGIAKAGDTIYFKDSGEPVTVKAVIDRVLFFNLNHSDVAEVIQNYGKQICLQETNPEKYKQYKYCSLIFLKNVKKIEPFQINKKGFGLMAAWISVENIARIKQ